MSLYDVKILEVPNYSLKLSRQANTPLWILYYMYIQSNIYIISFVPGSFVLPVSQRNGVGLGVYAAVACC